MIFRDTRYCAYVFGDLVPVGATSEDFSFISNKNPPRQSLITVGKTDFDWIWCRGVLFYSD